MLIILLLCAFRSGTDRYYLKKALGENVRGREVFFYLKPRNIFSLFRFYLGSWARRLAVIALCFLPCLAVTLSLVYYISYGRASLTVCTVLFFAVLVFAFNGFVYFFRFNSFFFLARFCFASGQFTSVKEIFSFSYKQIEGRRSQVLMKRLGFIPWFLSCVLVFPAFFVRAYYRESMTEFAAGLMDSEYLQS